MYIGLVSALGMAQIRPGLARKIHGALARRALKTVKDPELRAKLTPDYPMGCKRPVTSGLYYKAIQKPNVTYIAGGVDHIDATGITTTDGVRHEVDVIILATGFKFSEPMRNVTGDAGQLLSDVWAGSPKNYLSIAVAGFPNFFFVNGPPQALTSLCWAAEATAGYVIQWLELYRDGKVDRAAVRQEAQDRFQATLTAAYPATVFHACNSYFLSADGTPMVLAIPFTDLKTMLRKPALEDFAIQA
jgi:cation diffusion facilitator CzcD-associated flavoprotein CzcO